MPFFARERSVEKEFDKPLGTAGGETVRRETEDVGVVVLAREADGARVERDGGADAFDAVAWMETPMAEPQRRIPLVPLVSRTALATARAASL